MKYFIPVILFVIVTVSPAFASTPEELTYLLIDEMYKVFSFFLGGLTGLAFVMASSTRW